MKFTRKRMLDSFEELEKNMEGMEGNVNLMETWKSMNDEDLARHHRECFDAMYEDIEESY